MGFELCHLLTPILHHVGLYNEMHIVARKFEVRVVINTRVWPALRAGY